MGRPAKILFLSLSILILSLLMHEYTPHLIMPLMYNPTVKHLTTWVHKMINNPLILLDKEIISDEIIENNSVIQDKKIKLFTVEELNDYNGDVGSKGLCLAILGLVFNVKKGKDHYGPGGGYEFFSGRDGSRAFVSGDFSEEGLIDDISGLSSQDYIGLDEWVKFYKKDYKYVGKLIGRYYDKDGNPTQYNLEAQKWINDAYALKEKDNQEKKIFPPCNSEWFPESGSRVYCTKKSYQKDFSETSTQKLYPDIEFEELQERLERKSIILIDVREPEESVIDGYIPGSLNIPLQTLGEALLMSPEDFRKEYRFDKPSRKSLLATTCLLGLRARTAQLALIGAGYRNVRRYAGSLTGWKEKGGLVVFT